MKGANTRLLWIKLDIDIKYSEVSAELTKIAKDTALTALGMKVIASFVTRSPKSGNMHYRALVEPPAEFKPEHLAFIQFIIGDDPTRAKLNMIRAKDWQSYSKTPFGWNTLAITYISMSEGSKRNGGKSKGRRL